MTTHDCDPHGLPNCAYCENLTSIARRGRSFAYGEYRRTTPRKRKDRHVPFGATPDTSNTERRALRIAPPPGPEPIGDVGRALQEARLRKFLCQD